MKDCDTCHFTFVKRLKSNGGYTLQKQCFSCGLKDGNFYKFELVGGKKEVEKLPDFDEELEEQYYERKREESKIKWEFKRLEKREEFFDVYNKYLQSDKWRLKRKKVLERDEYICKACETNIATQVHHTSYEFIYDEPLFDLVSVCKKCHDKIEYIKKENKGLL